MFYPFLVVSERRTSSIVHTHSIGKDSAFGLGIRSGESHAKFPTVWIPVEFTTGIDKVIVVLDENRFIRSTLMLEGIPVS